MLRSYRCGKSSIVFLTIVDICRFAIRAGGVDPNDIVRPSRNQLCAIRSVREKRWTIRILVQGQSGDALRIGRSDLRAGLPRTRCCIVTVEFAELVRNTMIETR